MIGDVLAARSRRWLGRLVSWVLETPVNHIAVQVTMDHALEMTPRGPVLTPLAKLSHFTRWRPPVERADKYTCVTKLLQRYLGRGIRYGWLQALSIGCRRVCGLSLGFKAGSICSELGAEYAICAYGFRIPEDDIAPDKLVATLRMIGWREVPESEY